MADPGKLEQVTQGLGAVQTLTAVAAALGIGTLLRAGWKRATLNYDERLLVEIAKHKASQDRANEIRESADRLEGVDNTPATLRELADRLDEVANKNLNVAVATASWNNSRWRTWGQAAIVFSILVIYMDALIFSVTTRHYIPSSIETISLWTFSLLLLLALLIFTFVRSSWIDAEARNVSRWWCHRNERSISSTPSN